jgi:RNA polymerase sigma-70 factor (ECF subfamily)
MVVHLYYYEGYAQDEIAEILKISKTAVQTRMSRARKQLKEVLKEYE